MAKEQLQTALGALPGTVSWISSDLRYIEVNQQLADIFGMPRADHSSAFSIISYTPTPFQTAS